MTAVIGFLGAIIGAIMGGIATYLTTRSTMSLTLEHSYDQTLQGIRLGRYQGLFQLTGRLTSYWPPSVEESKREILEQYVHDFHEWYFGDQAGGMFLTPAAKESYMRLLNRLTEVALAKQDHPDGAPDCLLPTESEELRGLASDLRHQMTEDIGSANPPRLRWARPAPQPPPPHVGD